MLGECASAGTVRTWRSVSRRSKTTARSLGADSLVIGDLLRIPVASSVGAGELMSTVRSGDTLYDLAPRFHTSVEAIATLNPQITPERLMVGQKLRIPIAQLQPTQEHKP